MVRELIGFWTTKQVIQTTRSRFGPLPSCTTPVKLLIYSQNIFPP